MRHKQLYLEVNIIKISVKINECSVRTDGIYASFVITFMNEHVTEMISYLVFPLENHDDQSF